MVMAGVLEGEPHAVETDPEARGLDRGAQLVLVESDEIDASILAHGEGARHGNGAVGPRNGHGSGRHSARFRDFYAP